MILLFLPLLLKHLEGKRWLADFQDGAVPAVIGCLLGACVVLGMASIDNVKSLGIFLLVGLVAILFKFPSWLMIPLGGLLGYVANA